MDLPLAWGEPSPPNALRKALRFARFLTDQSPGRLLQHELRPCASRARFEFAACTHREKCTPIVVISRARGIVKRRVTLHQKYSQFSAHCGFLASSNTIFEGATPWLRQASKYNDI